MAKKEHFCFNCGESLGEYESLGGELDWDSCGAKECTRELRYALQAADADRRAAAEAEDYQEYDGYGEWVHH